MAILKVITIWYCNFENNTLYPVFEYITMELPELNINKNARSNSQCTLHICRTGKKKQYYTLYHEGVHINDYGGNYFCDYNGNLSYKGYC